MSFSPVEGLMVMPGFPPTGVEPLREVRPCHGPPALSAGECRLLVGEEVVRAFGDQISARRSTLETEGATL